MARTAPTHTVVATDLDILTYDQAERIAVWFANRHWIDLRGMKYRALDGMWTDDDKAGLSIDLTTLTPIAGA